jgi:hypothetical protein
MAETRPQGAEDNEGGVVAMKRPAQWPPGHAPAVGQESEGAMREFV